MATSLDLKNKYAISATIGTTNRATGRSAPYALAVRSNPLRRELFDVSQSKGE